MAGTHWNEENLTIANGLVPSGVIAPWEGTTPPPGWALCNGQNGTPDLRDRFIVGAGNEYSVGATGGASSITHSHTYSLRTTDWPKAKDAAAETLGRNMRAARPEHYHTATGTSGSVTLDNRPPYYALAFIMKL